jgi:hypothetical protein
VLATKRCKYHGGLSTGSRTPAGKVRAVTHLKLKQFRKT